MKRRDFLRADGTGLLLGSALSGHTTAAEARTAWCCIHQGNELETAVSLTGLPQNLSVLQISDSHISCDGPADEEYQIYSKRMGSAYLAPKHFKTGQSAPEGVQQLAYPATDGRFRAVRFQPLPH